MTRFKTSGMTKHLILVTLLSVFCFFSKAQQIKGTVKDAETGEVLPNTNILIHKTKLGGITDHNGNFTINNIPEGKYTIEARFVGYAGQKQNVEIISGKTTKLNFELTPEIHLQEQIVVTANKLGDRPRQRAVKCDSNQPKRN